MSFKIFKNKLFTVKNLLTCDQKKKVKGGTGSDQPPIPNNDNGIGSADTVDI